MEMDTIDANIKSELGPMEINPLEDDYDLNKIEDTSKHLINEQTEKIANDAEASISELALTSELIDSTITIADVEDVEDVEDVDFDIETKPNKNFKKSVSAKTVEKTKVEENLDKVVTESIDCTQSTGILIYHSSGVGQPVGVKCDLCDRTFEHPKTFKAHKKYIDFAGYICESCGITCFSQSGFHAHTKRHASEKEFQCNQCDAAFYRKTMLTQHMARHKGDTPFQCEVCAKCFVHRAALSKHKNIHNEALRRIDCKVCEKKFRTVAHLRRHMAIHTGAKPFSCPICGNRFSQSYNMKAHMKLHDESQLHQEVVTKPLNCQKCSKDCTNLLEYEEHIKSCS